MLPLTAPDLARSAAAPFEADGAAQVVAYLVRTPSYGGHWVAVLRGDLQEARAAPAGPPHAVAAVAAAAPRRRPPEENGLVTAGLLRQRRQQQQDEQARRRRQRQGEPESHEGQGHGQGGASDRGRRVFKEDCGPNLDAVMCDSMFARPHAMPTAALGHLLRVCHREVLALAQASAPVCRFQCFAVFATGVAS